MKKANETAKKWFGNWANEYDDSWVKVKRHHKLLEAVVQASLIKDNDSVLDLGCGTGLLSLKLLKKADCLILGVDSSPEMLEIFKNKIKKLNLLKNITCQLENAERLGFKENSFDIIASTVTLHHVKNKYPVIRKINRLLKPGGRLVLGDIDMDTTGSLTDPKRLIRIMDYLKEEYALALHEGGIKAFSRMYDNGKKHILNDGEYCISFKQWEEICSRAKFKKITVKPLPDFEWFKVLVAIK
jgi:ubiquinone/menaquinone biosynthesis C-methylase UbiE